MTISYDFIIEPLNLKIIQNPWNVFFENILLEILSNYFWETWNSSPSSDSSSEKIFFKINCFSEVETARLFECTKQKSVRTLFKWRYVLFENKILFTSVQKNKLKNKCYFELKVYNSLGLHSRLCLTILD